MFDFLTHLFDTSDFPPRWQCGNWTTGHGWLHILSDLGVWLAYIAIPCVLGFFVLRRRDIPFRGIFLLFGAFILACGTTHLMEALIFWWPAYRFAGVIKLFTAIVSWGTVLALIPVTPKVLSMRGPEELQREIAARNEVERSLQKTNAELTGQVEALQASEERFRLLVEGTRDHAIYMLDPKGRVASWNPGAERIKQYTAEVIIGQHFARFYSAEDVDSRKPERDLEIAAAQGCLEEEGWRVRKDGVRFWANTVLTALRDKDGTLRGYSKITRDMTERKQAEEKERRFLQEDAARRQAEMAEQKNKEIMQLVHKIGQIGHWEWNAVTDENKWSPEIEALYGLAPGGFEGGYQGWAKLVHPEDLPRAEADVRRAMESGEYFTEFRVIWPDGSIHWLETRALVIRDEHGKALRMVGANMDITERKRVEEELRSSERELQERIGQLAEEDRRKTEFLATLAHELRNPLAPIRNGLQILRLTHDAKACSDAQDMMERQLAQLVRLVDDLLDISRISRNKLELRRTRLRLDAMIESAVETARPLIDSKEQLLTVTLPAEPIYLDADLTRLAQVFSNLLNNSAKYTDQGGRIDLNARREAAQIVIAVRDTGIGIPPEALPGLFNMFSQVDQSLERTQGGLGIGLALVKGLVEMHGGTVQAFSAGSGKGSEFIVRLPLPQVPVEDEPAAAQDEVPVFHRRRVLVVDDNLDAAGSLVLMLSLMGHEARSAHDGMEALEVAAACRPDVIFLDIGLPRLNGYEVCRQIRRRPWGEAICIVAVTGWGQEVDRDRSHDAGFNAHMVKPMDVSILTEILSGA